MLWARPESTATDWKVTLGFELHVENIGKDTEPARLAYNTTSPHSHDTAPIMDAWRARKAQKLVTDICSTFDAGATVLDEHAVLGLTDIARCGTAIPVLLAALSVTTLSPLQRRLVGNELLRGCVFASSATSAIPSVVVALDPDRVGGADDDEPVRCHGDKYMSREEWQTHFGFTEGVYCATRLMSVYDAVPAGTFDGVLPWATRVLSQVDTPRQIVRMLRTAEYFHRPWVGPALFNSLHTTGSVLAGVAAAVIAPAAWSSLAASVARLRAIHVLSWHTHERRYVEAVVAAAAAARETWPPPALEDEFYEAVAAHVPPLPTASAWQGRERSQSC